MAVSLPSYSRYSHVSEGSAARVYSLIAILVSFCSPPPPAFAFGAMVSGTLNGDGNEVFEKGQLVGQS